MKNDSVHTVDAPARVTCEASEQEDVPPDGGYGWVCVAACFAINCFTWGAVSVR
jgi:hypothetical protein